MLAELNNVLTVNVQFVFIAKLPNSIFPNGFQTALYIVDLDRLAHLRQLVDDIANLVDHQIAGEVTVNFINGFKVRNTRLNAFDDSIRCLH